ncbi:MAG: class I SAM-dependent methyltransferase, partial [Betaproteobacteria bacterium]
MFYRLEIKPDYGKASVVNNMATNWSRIKKYVNPVKVENILDVGCAYGFGLQYLKGEMPGASIYGIESSPDGCASLESPEIGGKLITNDFDLDWEQEYRNKMDIIIVRHVFEHVLEPMKTLAKLRTALKPDGVIYFAVPD